MKIDYMYYLTECVKVLDDGVISSDRKLINDALLKIFDCVKINRFARKVKFHEHYCYSKLILSLHDGVYSKVNRTFTLTFKGKHNVEVMLRLQGSGLVFVKVIETPEGVLPAPLVLKTSFKSLGPLNGILLHLM